MEVFSFFVTLVDKIFKEWITIWFLDTNVHKTVNYGAIKRGEIDIQQLIKSVLTAAFSVEEGGNPA